MFKKKTEPPKLKEQSKEEQLGPRPADIPSSEPLITWQVILKYGLPSVEVLAHAHNFGEETSCDRPRSGTWTHFVVHGDTTWVESRRYVDTVPGPHGTSQSVYRWEWGKDRKTQVVFSIRTEEVTMVAAVDNSKPVETEMFNVLDRRELEAPAPSMKSANPYGAKIADGPVFDVQF